MNINIKTRTKVKPSTRKPLAIFKLEFDKQPTLHSKMCHARTSCESEFCAKFALKSHEVHTYITRKGIRVNFARSHHAIFMRRTFSCDFSAKYSHDFHAKDLFVWISHEVFTRYSLEETFGWISHEVFTRYSLEETYHMAVDIIQNIAHVVSTNLRFYCVKWERNSLNFSRNLRWITLEMWYCVKYAHNSHELRTKICMSIARKFISCEISA